MPKYVPEIILSIGAAVLVAGVAGLAYAVSRPDDIVYYWLTPYSVPTITMISGIVAAIGGGVTVFGVLMMRRRY